MFHKQIFITGILFFALFSVTKTVYAGTDDETIFNWAEQTYPQFFSPTGATTQSAQGYLFRYYSGTDTYAGTKDGQVYVLGDLFGGLLPVGSVESLLAQINASASSGGSNTNSGNTNTIATLNLSNDQNIAREGEVAYSGIPIAKSQGLSNTSQLTILNSNQQPIPAQFQVLSRWGGVVDDETLPIRWLEVAFSADIAANSQQPYYLTSSDDTPNDTTPVSISSSGNKYVVDTGVSQFTLNPAHPALLESARIGSESLNFSNGSALGPTLVLANNTTTQAQVDSNSFQILQKGPVRVMVAVEGHFIGSNTQCHLPSGAYEAQGFTLIASFSRGQSYVDFQIHYRNECSDAENSPWTDDAIVVEKFSYELPLALSGNPQKYYAADQSVTTSNATTLRVEQQPGSGSPWKRQAIVQQDNSTTSQAEFFPNPMLAIANSQLSVSAQIPWMRFREPQAIQIKDNQLSLEFISQSLTVGEARGIWNHARIDFSSISNTTTLAADLETQRQQNMAALERGLIPQTDRNDLNLAKIFPSLGNSSTSQIKTEYLSMLEMLHQDTLNQQWANNRTYGSQLWPDIQFSAYPIGDPENSSPSNNDANMNYWNASRNELLEYLRSGDLKWVWDFALPQTWLQFFSAYANIGDHSHGNRNGFALTSGGCGRADGCSSEADLGLDNLGHWHRSGFGSDDYTYTHGDVAYVIRPLYPLLKRFAQAGKTAINRYVDDNNSREQFVSARVIQRQVIQHFVLLANCAEFVPGETGQACHNKLKHIMQEFDQQNFANGYMCLEDDPGASECFMPQQFMQNSLMYPFFYRLYLNYGDAFGSNLKKMLTNQPWTYFYQHSRPSQVQTPDYNNTSSRNEIVVDSLWPNELSCQYSNRNCNVNPYNESPDSELYSLLEANKTHTLALYLMADALGPALNLCQVVKTALAVKNIDILGADSGLPADVLYLPDLWFSNAIEGTGWSKGTSQMMQAMAFGVGLYDSCQ